VSFSKSLGLFAVLLSFLLLASPLLARAHEELSVIKEPFMVSDPNNDLHEERSVVAVDNNGNAHLIWIDGSGYSLFYAMFDPDGNQLIAPTELLNGVGSYKYRKPKLAVDDSNCLHIVYHSEAAEVSYFKVDPYRDDLDGDEANPADIIVVGPTIVSVEDDVQSVAPAIATGSAVHIVWRDGSYDEQGAIWYTKLDEDGNVLISPVMLTDQVMFPDYSNEPSIAVDSQGNVHIVWNDYWETSETEIAYMLVDGGDGSVLIDKTLLTPDDGEKGRRPMVVVDSQDCAHIVWQDKRSGTTEIYYTKINPYLDDLSGDAADPDTVTIIDDTRLSEEDGYKSKCPAVTIDQYDRLSIIWWDEKWLDAADSELSYMALDSDGATLVPETRITWDGPDVDKYDYWFVPWIASGGGVRVFITYTTESYEDYDEEVWLTILELPVPIVGGYIIPSYAPSTMWMGLIALAATVATLLYTKYIRK